MTNRYSLNILEELICKSLEGNTCLQNLTTLQHGQENIKLQTVIMYCCNYCN